MVYYYSTQQSTAAAKQIESNSAVNNEYAGMAELADALDSGSSEGNFMQVQFLLPAPKTEPQVTRHMVRFFAL